MVDKDDAMAKERMASLKALRDQATADAERTQLALDSSGDQGISPDMLKEFARKARDRIRLEGGGYRRDHLRAGAACRGCRRRGSHHGIEVEIVANAGRRLSGKPTAFGV